MSTPLAIAIAARDLTRHELARRVDCSPVWIGQLVSGRARPSPALAERIAQEVDIPAGDLFAEADQDVVVSFVRRTTTASGVPEFLEDEVIAESVASILRGTG